MSGPASEAVSDRIRQGLDGGYPIIHIRGHDEARLEHLLRELCRERHGGERKLAVWTLTGGLVEDGVPADPALADPLAALRHVLARAEGGFFLFKDLPLLLDGRPDLVRALRDLYQALLGRDTVVFLSCSEYRLPHALEREVFLAEQEPPGEGEILAEVQRLGADAFDADTAAVLAGAMKGLMLNEVGHLLRRLVVQGCTAREPALAEVRREKAAALMGEACLRFIPDTVDLDRVGGLENLKDWVRARAGLFAASQGGRVPMPAGVLFMGVSGCGKSMAAKVIASAWALPLVRLDMNLVLSGAHGSPEYAFDHALRTAERIAPLVLWIDEMENSFGYDSDARHGGNNPNIFSGFLTWMQEKPAGVFVVATANRIEKLPAEVMRKGRFDQLFFLDLPTDAERQRIVDIHLRANGADPARFNLAALSAATKNWSGAEIEQGVKAAVVDAWQAGREFGERDLMLALSRMVPLSRTMSEQIKALRVWSQERATPASAKET